MRDLKTKIDNFKEVLRVKNNLDRYYECKDLDDVSLGIFLKIVDETHLIDQVNKLAPIRSTASGAILAAVFDFSSTTPRGTVLYRLHNTAIRTGDVLNNYWLNKLDLIHPRNNFEYAITYLYFLSIQRGLFIPDMSEFTEKMKYDLIRMIYDNRYSLINDGSEEAYVYLKYIEESGRYEPAYGGEGYSIKFLKKNNRQCNYPERFLTNKRNDNFNDRAKGKDITNRLIFKGSKKNALAAEYFMLTYLTEDPTIELSNIMCYSDRDKFGNLITNQDQKCAIFKRFVA